MKRLYFIGIGGSGMGPLARFAALLGYEVFGSDHFLTKERSHSFTSRGIKVFDDHNPSYQEGADVVVYSSAIKENHPEMLRAKERASTGEIKLLHRMDLLDLLMRRTPFAFAVAGTHGKTSASSMMGWALMELGFDPHILVGGRPLYLPEGIRCGSGKSVVYETDESDGSFLKSSAPYRLLLNIDEDHIDHYGTMDKLAESMFQFIEGGEYSIINGDDLRLGNYFDLQRESRCKTGISFTNRNLQSKFESLLQEGRAAILYRGEFSEKGDSLEVYRTMFKAGVKEEAHLGCIALSIIGRHFFGNALLVLGLIDGVTHFEPNFKSRDYSSQKLIEALNSFPGVERRIEFLGRVGNSSVYDDYGHHPTEIAAVISALKERMESGGELRVVFQPHRYTRTAQHFRAFADVFKKADRLFLLPIYSAGENEIRGIQSGMILSCMREDSFCRTKVECIDKGEWSKIFQTPSPPENSVTLFIGAGDISNGIRSYMKKQGSS